MPLRDRDAGTNRVDPQITFDHRPLLLPWKQLTAMTSTPSSDTAAHVVGPREPIKTLPMAVKTGTPFH
ncbi:hypothetical protein Sliba_61270 [Streptomyces nigrescens]|uniref:Uncharacterized protein n=1 Tax=Streptomyces nigrescens TaxID=1920 RepID=A0A640TQZ9_STRNI|nr:hypothetical protein Sliba_61270 [Streptomyces libani subsp. libani]GGV98710.1 hypothetical protein GCM10010500_48020 [Streptomyces libani subsp. libani]